jgi:hypothetical protein
MNTSYGHGGRVKAADRFRLVLAMISCGGMFAEATSHAQMRESLTGESAAQALKKSILAEPYDLQYGPVRANVGASLGVNYTDNVFYSEQRKDDVMIRPEVTLDALWPITEINALRLSLGVSYEWYQLNPSLNAKAPLINPGTELVFNVFVGDCLIRLHEAFSYQESVFFNSFSGPQPFYNLHNVGTFARLDNKIGADVTWDVGKVVLNASYDHENFKSYTAKYDYLDRQSEWFGASAGYFLGDHLQSGVEGRVSLHNYDQETTLNDNWRGRVGPFVEATLLEGVKLRTGGGYDWARYDAAGSGSSDYDSYYAYARLSQQTRLFTHSVEGGHETLLGDGNANNIRITYMRYSIESPIVEHVDLGAHFSVNYAEEYGGPSGYDERFTYYEAGFKGGWQFHRNWRAELGYQYLLKNSDLAGSDFQRNMVTVAVVWKF